jgi:hypothetical protein
MKILSRIQSGRIRPLGRRVALLIAVLGLFALPAAAATTISPNAPTFTASPLGLGVLRSVIPLGNLNPPGHSFPTNHVYFNWRDQIDTTVAASLLPTVYAPASGTIASITRRSNGADGTITLHYNRQFYFYVDHVSVDADLAVGDSVSAGQRIGVGSSLTVGVDLGVMNFDRVPQFFLAPLRTTFESRYGDSPLRYFAEPLKTSLDALVLTTAADKNGAYALDQAGHLVGNWYVVGLAEDQTSESAWTKQLAFAYDESDPSRIVVAIGGTLAVTAGQYTVRGNSPDPAAVTTSNGIVAYTLVTVPLSSQVPGTLLVQLIDDFTLRAEVVAAGTAAFSTAAITYERGGSGFIAASGWWWSPSRPGSGWAIEIQGDRLMAAGFTYGSDGQPVWHLAIGAVTGRNRFSGDLIAYANGQTLAGDYRAPVSLGGVGTLSLAFTTASRATLAFGSDSVALERFEFVDSGLFLGSAGAPPQSGWWWAPAESGRGYFLEIQNGSLFFAAFLYGVDGVGRWYIANGPMTSNTLFEATLAGCAGGPTLAGGGGAAACATNAGTISLAFAGATAATLTLPNGIQVAIQRFTF